MYQSLTVVGRLGRDPEMKFMPNGDPLCSFSLATDRVYNDRNGQKQTETTWFRVSVFGKQAETVNQYLRKGRMVLVEGRLRPDPKTGSPSTFTRQDGTVGTSFEIVANTVRFLSSPQDGNQGGGSNTGGSGGGGNESHDSPNDDSIPF
jgi:single-strand DNA-binding protein